MPNVIPLRNVPESIRKLITKKHRAMKKDLGMRKLALGRAAVLLIKDLQLENKRLMDIIAKK